MNRKGQGTIEYLVIIAIVIVIALVVVGLLLQIMDQGSAVPEQSARLAWQTASPIGIIDWGQSDTNLSLVLKNNSGQTITDLNVTVTDGTPAGKYTLSPGATEVITITVTECTSSQCVYSKEKIKFEYNSGGIDGRKQSGAADIIVTGGN